jgi:hypothetical protein
MTSPDRDTSSIQTDRDKEFLSYPLVSQLTPTSFTPFGVARQPLSQFFPPKSGWTLKDSDVPDQTGKTVLVTGSNRGIGSSRFWTNVFDA